MKEQNYSADINLDGRVDFYDYVLLSAAMGSRFGDSNYIARCNLYDPDELVIDENDFVIDYLDLAVFSEQWMAVEDWRSE